MKSILYILPFFPYPLTSGGHQALFNGIMAVKDFYNVSLAYPAYDTAEMQEREKALLAHVPQLNLYPFYQKENKPTLKNRIIWSMHYRLRRSFGLTVSKEEDPVMDKCRTWLSSIAPLSKDWLLYVEKVCNENHFDIIQVEMPWFVSQVLGLPDTSKKIYVHHELGFVRRELESGKLPDNAYVRAIKQYADFNEIALLNMYDSIISLSPIDAEKLREKGVKVPVYSSFATIDTKLSNYKPANSNGKRLTFVGPDGHNPNLEGITWFLEKCWKELLERDIEYSLEIIGGWTGCRIEEFTKKYPNVHFLGYVDDLKDVLSGSIMIVPINVGSGIRMKILEASSIGVPFVSTSVGAEGIPVENGKHCLIADTPADFIKAIVSLKDHTLQTLLVKEARDMVCKNYSLDALSENRLSIYKTILSNNVN